MLKKATLWWLLMLLVGPLYLFATPSFPPTTSPHLRSISVNCPTIESELLYTTNLTNTYTYVYCPRDIRAVRNQFRYRPVGNSDWLLSRVSKTNYQFLGNLEIGTDYEFQISYECTNGIWSDFSESANFTTTGVKVIEEEEDNSDEEDTSDSTSVISVLKILDAFASCGDSLICTKIQSSQFDSLSEMQFAIAWDVTELQLMSIEANETVFANTTLATPDSTLLEHGVFLFQQDSMAVDTTKTNLFSLCFAPLSMDSTSISFVDPSIDYLQIVKDVLSADPVFVVDSILVVDSMLVIDSVLAVDSVFVMDSVLVVDSMLVMDSILVVDTVFVTDSVLVVDSMLVIDSILVVDSMFAIESILVVDSMLVMDSIFIVDAVLVIDSVEIRKTIDSTPINKFGKTALQHGALNYYDCSDINLGGGTCDPIDGSGLSTTTVEMHNSYIYTSQPNGKVNNQFRYRIVGTENWHYTNVDTIYFRRIIELQSGTPYEYQTSQQCPDSTFSDYSISHSFTTLGDNPDGTGEEIINNEDDGDIITSDACEPVDSSLLNVTTIKQYFAHVYTPQPYGPIRNQFRYRVVGRSSWFYTSISSTYFRYLQHLEDGQEYEYQVSHECENGVWSDFSGSHTFETLPSIN